MEPGEFRTEGDFPRFLPLKETVKQLVYKEESTGDPITNILESSKSVDTVDEIAAGVVVFNASEVPMDKITSASYNLYEFSDLRVQAIEEFSELTTVRNKEGTVLYKRDIRFYIHGRGICSHTAWHVRCLKQ